MIPSRKQRVTLSLFGIILSGIENDVDRLRTCDAVHFHSFHFHDLFVGYGFDVFLYVFLYIKRSQVVPNNYNSTVIQSALEMQSAHRNEFVVMRLSNVKHQMMVKVNWSVDFMHFSWFYLLHEKDSLAVVCG